MPIISPNQVLAGLMLVIGLFANPRAEDWPLYGRDYDNSRFSALAAITPANVGRLQRAWVFRTGLKASFQASPIVVDGVMYVSTPFNHVIAVDAKSGQPHWRYQHRSTVVGPCCGPANRGVAVSHDLVFIATIDARVIALDRLTGAVKWDTRLIDPNAGAMEELSDLLGVPELTGAIQTGQTGYSANMAPQVIDDLVLIGVTGTGYGLHVESTKDGAQSGSPAISVVGLSGEQLGLRGFLVALDAKTGTERWRWYSVPSAQWTGNFVAATAYGSPLKRDIAGERSRVARYAAAWQFGGGSIWTTPAIDRERRLIFIGTGNPAPQMDDETRPGDNLHTVSLVALAFDTGQQVWAYQQVPHDRWGYDVASPPVLFKLNWNGRTREVVGQASKTGWFFVHDRATGELVYKSEPFVAQENLFTPPTDAGIRITPSGLGACSWSPVALDQKAERVYIAASHGPAMYYRRRLAPKPGQPWDSYTLFQPIAEEAHGLLAAIDISTGRLAWRVKLAKPMIGGVLATGSGLVFVGQGQGELSAFNAANGALLWSDQTAAGVNAPPISYAVDDTQFIAVAAGGNSLYGYPLGDELIAYTLRPESR